MKVMARPWVRWAIWLFLGYFLSRLVLLGAMLLWSLVLLADDRELTGSTAELRTFDLIALIITGTILWLGNRAWLQREASRESAPHER